jgi:group II intron reverse transcriptase/maturase
MSTELLRVADRAKRDPEYRFFSLAHLIDKQALERAYGRLRKDAAVGVDGVTVEDYGRNLQGNLEGLHERLRAGRYRHQPIRRVHIPKGNGKVRPIGISTVEDKVVQGALREVLEAVYEQTFLECSVGFRAGRGPHDAVRALYRRLSGERVNVVLEADIVSFFDSIDRKMLQAMLRERVQDGSIARLVGKCLHVGVLEGEDYSEPEVGTVQGSIISPLLGNIYLHHVLDKWFEAEVKPRMRGEAHLLRYADDFVIGFEREDDARRVWDVLGRRFEKFGLTLHPEKTRLVAFHRPRDGGGAGKGPETFDSLGFTWYWRKSRKGHWYPACKTKRRKLSQAIGQVHEWCKIHRHLPVAEQHDALKSRIQGHLNYFGVSGNGACLSTFVHWATRAWFKWLTRRSQRARLKWERFQDLLRDFSLPKPRIVVRLWGE